MLNVFICMYCMLLYQGFSQCMHHVDKMIGVLIMIVLYQYVAYQVFNYTEDAYDCQLIVVSISTWTAMVALSIVENLHNGLCCLIFIQLHHWHWFPCTQAYHMLWCHTLCVLWWHPNKCRDVAPCIVIVTDFKCSVWEQCTVMSGCGLWGCDARWYIPDLGKQWKWSQIEVGQKQISTVKLSVCSLPWQSYIWSHVFTHLSIQFGSAGRILPLASALALIHCKVWSFMWAFFTRAAKFNDKHYEILANRNSKYTLLRICQSHSHPHFWLGRER